MQRSLVLFIVLALLGGAGGCGKKEANPQTAAGEPNGAAGPLDGRAPSKASQLVGTWLATTEGEYLSFEFMKDGRALITTAMEAVMTGRNSGIMVNYEVLEGGRLSLIAPDGRTQMFEAVIARDQLELKGRQLLGGVDSQRFRRLREGQTVAQALQEQREAEAKAYQERVAALEAFLKQPGLVLAFTETGPGAPASMALDINPYSGGFSGQAWHDDQPPHLNHISGQLALDQSENRAQVLVTFGPRIAPPAPQPDGGGQIAMNVTGAGKDLRIASQVTFGDGGPAHELVLRSDPRLHAAIVKRYEGELARIEGLKQPLIQTLKDYAVLHGQLQPLDTRQTPETVDLILARDPESGQYRVEGVTIGQRDRGELVANAAAEIVIADGQPRLRIVSPPTREYLLALPDPAARRLTGQWMNYGRGQAAQFEVVEALDAAARDARFEAQRKALKALGSEAVFTGLAFEDSGFGLEMPINFRLQLTVQPDGSAAAQADYPSMSTLMTAEGKVAETPFGPRLQLNYTAAESTPRDQIFFRSLQRGMWSLTPVQGSGPVRLAGHFTGPPVRPTVLTQVTDASKAALRQKLLDALKADGRFYLARVTGWQTPGQVPTVVEWKLDEASGRITGTLLTGGRSVGTYEKALNTYEGQLKEENGWLMVDLVQTSQLKPNDQFVTGMPLMVSEDANGVLHVGGPRVGIGRVVNGQRVSDAPPSLDHPIDFIPVADTDPATREAINQALAAVEQAKADAIAQTQAQAQAALEARRAKMAPYYPAFQSPHGAVLTTNMPLELGAVIREAVVDEDQATITGKGIDLYEMPFREFTFETGLDAWGNLTVTTTTAKAPYAFNARTDKGLTGRYMALTLLSEADRTRLDSLIALGQRLHGASPAELTVQVLDPAAAKARETGMAASALPGVAIYRNAKNDQVAAMFTPQANGRYRWAGETVALRLHEPARGQALYLKNGGPTDNLTVVINGVHRATITAIAQYGAAVITLPADLDILDLRLEAGGTAQARGVVLLK